MPFTLSHAVVALPFVRTPLLPAAIAVGAMAPDLPLFLRGTPLTYELTHTSAIAGMLLAFVLLMLWYALLRPAVRELSPAGLARRLPEEWDATGLAAWRMLQRPRARHPIWSDGVLLPILLALSVFLGFVTHVVWDAFTHEGRWGSDLIPALAEPWGPLPGYTWLQHGSSAFGLIALGVFGILWLRRRDAASDVPRLLPGAVRGGLWLALPVILGVAWVWGLAAHGPLRSDFTAAHLAYRVLPPACAVWGVIALGMCLVVVVLRRRR